MTPHPDRTAVVQGGQGRTSESLISDAQAIVSTFLWCLAALAVAGLWRWLG